MKSNFNDCLNRLLRDEGGYSNHPADPGGPTNFGITLTDYRLYINKEGTADDVRKMSIDDAKSIYRSKYWDALNCNSLPSGVDYTVFDYGVNSGLARPRKDLQRFGTLTGAKLIDAINDERMAFLRDLNTFPVFGKGWTRRVDGVRSYSKQLAQKDHTTGPVVATAGIGIGAYLSHFWHNHEITIVVCAILVAGALGYIVHKIRNRGK